VGSRGGEKMKKTAANGIVVDAVLTFCENAAELGCPRGKDVDMWFRELSKGKMREVAKKIIAIQKRKIERVTPFAGVWIETVGISRKLVVVGARE
jgi:hypothetical protein